MSWNHPFICFLNRTSPWNASEFERCYRDEDCMQMEGESWREQDCSASLPFLCERSGMNIVFCPVADQEGGATGDPPPPFPRI